MCVPKVKTPEPLPPAPEIEEKAPDRQVSAKKSRDTKRGSGTSTGLNRFLITPGSGGSGANIPE